MASLLADWNNTLGMLYRMIHHPAVFKRYAPFINTEYLYKGEAEKRVKGLRALFKLLVELDKEHRLKEVLGDGDKSAIYPFLGEVRKLPDGETKEAALDIMATLKDNKEIAVIAESEGCLNQFIDYMKANIIQEWAAAFNEPYRQGKIVPATNMIKDLVAKLDRLNIGTFETLNADTLYDRFNVGKNQGQNNFYLGIKQLDELEGGHGFCEPNTLTIWMAPPGGGKSMMSITLIVRAVLQRKYVNWTVVEDRRRTFEARLVAAISGIPINVLKNAFDSLTPDQVNAFKRAQVLIKEYVHIDYMYGESIESIHERKIQVDQERRVQGLPEYEVDGVDYSMHVATSQAGAQDKVHERLLNAYTIRKNFALKTKIGNPNMPIAKTGKICHDFLQVNRGGLTKMKGGTEHLEMDNIAGAFDIARIGDSIISINRAQIDIDNEQARLWVAKGRDGSPSKAIIVPCEFSLGRYNMAGAHFPADDAPVKKNEYAELLDREI